MRWYPTWAIIVAVAALATGALFLFAPKEKEPEPLPEAPKETGMTKTIGTSVQGRAIEAFTYGTGDTQAVFVGGIHGGYEWNSVLLAYTLMDYLAATPSAIPPGVRITVIPNANPDGVFAVVKKEGRFQSTDVPAGDHPLGRFNAHSVDLNRNFGCKWQAEASWRGNKVSAGTAAFSEPEAQALRDFFLKEKPKAAVFFHSQAGAVYASECEAGILPETLAIMNVYATAAAYPAVSVFDAYPVTGDVEGWLASIDVPALSVEFNTHESMEWDKNKAGIEALVQYLGNTR